ncbi:MAG: PDZ domain-containing protein [Alphaproteobacteria bacterium]|nr:PDZ domain-containing protein [Alphaproteobacteria bacterium]
MHSLFRPLAVFGFSSVVSGAVLYLAGDEPAVGVVPMQASASSQRAHDLSRLRVVHEALAPVFESYVEPDRVDPDRMFTAALEAVERLVPEVMFRREGSRLRAHIGTWRTVLDVGTIDDQASLEAELRRVGDLLQQHLDPSDVPVDGTEMDPFAAIEFAMGNGILATLDPHSALLPPDQSREMDVENRGAFGGLGITIRVDDDRLVIQHALPGKPAAMAGLREGDELRRIDGQSTVNLTEDEAVELLRGPEGASVTLEVVSADAPTPRTVVVARANIKINEVEGFAMPGGTAYVRIPSFHATVYHDLVDQLRRLGRDDGGLRGLVLDLRDNPGGYLNQAIAVADTFLSEGEIVATRGPHDRRPQIELARAANTEDPYPIVVLVNANSASASEIVAGALRNNQRAVIVGERTFGKGSVQNLHALPYDSKLKITIAHYLTPGERSIQSVGIPADIELVPATVGLRPEVAEDGTATPAVPDAELFARDHVRREADLDEHLDRQDPRDEQAMYTVAYHQDWTAVRDAYGPPDVAHDPELAFALDLLAVSARGPSHEARRGDMLAAAGPLVRRYAAASDAAIASAFDDLGLDWSAGPTPARPQLQAELTVDGDGQLHAGATQDVTVTVTNVGDETAWRTVAELGDHELLGGLEFFFGRLDPGASRSWSRTLHVSDGWPSEVSRVPVRVRSGDGSELADVDVDVVVAGQPLPRLAWSWRVEPEGGGTIDLGDTVRIVLSVRNVGDGPSHGATARIRNRSGRTLDILHGTLHAGRMVSDDGAACAVVDAGWDGGRIVGNADPSSARVASRLPARWAPGCHRELLPGEAWEGSFDVAVREPLDGSYRVDLTLEDSVSYDHAAIVREGFYRYYQQEESLRFALGGSAQASSERVPPRIDISAAPGTRVQQDLVTLSGRVADDDGLDHVVVYADDDKVFYEGSDPGQGLPTIPFTADVRLTPGEHTLTVLARDARGFVSTASRVVTRSEDVRTADASGAGLTP